MDPDPVGEVNMKKKFIVLISVVLLIGSGIASACKCMEKNNPREEFYSSDAVFTGRVISMEQRYGMVVAMRAERVFKGPIGNEVVVHTGLGSRDCGFPFEIGESYLVYARQDPMNGELITNSCFRTAELSWVNEEIRALEEIKSELESGRPEDES